MKRESQEQEDKADASEQTANTSALNVKAEVQTENTAIRKPSAPVGVSYSVNETDNYKKAVEKAKQKYYKMIFAERQNENESRDIYLCCNGEDLMVQRGVEVILPERYYCIARDAVVNSYRMDKATNKLVPVVYRRFAYSVLGEATEEEYLALVEKCKREKEEQKRAKEAEQGK